MHTTKHLNCRWAAALLVFVAAVTAHGADYEAGTLLITEPWSRPTPPTASAGAVYLSIRNRGSTADRLLSLSTPVAGAVQIHASRTVNGMMEMRQLPGLDCPAHATVNIEPGSMHLMLVGLSRPLTAGSHFPLTLRFRGAGEVTVQVHVGDRE